MFLPGKSHGQKCLVELQSEGATKKVRHNLATKQQRLCEVTQRIMRTFREFYSKASKLQHSQSLSEAHS